MADPRRVLICRIQVDQYIAKAKAERDANAKL